MSRSLSWKIRTSSSPATGELPAVEVPPSFEELEHPVELAGERLGVALDLAGEIVDFALHPIGAPGGPQVECRGRGSRRTGWSLDESSRLRRRVVPVVDRGRGGRCDAQPGQAVGHAALEGLVVRGERRGQLDLSDDDRRIVELGRTRGSSPAARASARADERRRPCVGPRTARRRRPRTCRRTTRSRRRASDVAGRRRRRRAGD